MSRQSTPDLLGEASPASDAVAEVFGNRTMLDPAVIRIDGGTQMRDGLNDATVTEYAEVMREVRGWASFPPCVVFYDGAKYWMADGFHRYAAFGRAGLTVMGLLMPAEVRSGTRRDAVLHAAGANASHGLRRTSADKRRAVATLLEDEEWRQWSAAEIARRCKVDDKTVAAVKRDLQLDSLVITSEIRSDNQTVKFTDRSGHERTMATGKIGKTREEPKRLEVWEIETHVWRWLRGNLPAEDQIPYLENFHKWENRQPVTIWITSQQSDQRPWRARDLIQASNNILDQLRQRTSKIEQSVATVEETPEPEPEPIYTKNAVQSNPWTNPRAIGDVTIWKADSRNLTDDTTSIPLVDLVITSPPYNVGIEYSEHFDKLQQDRYIDLLHNVFLSCHKVMRHGARIAVVVPFGIGRNPWQPMSLFVAQQMQAAGFQLRGQIIWDKGTTGNRTSWGSFRSPSDPCLRDTCECIIVAHKSQSQAAVPHLLKDDKGSYTAWLERPEYFMELAQDHWQVAPESAQHVGHPAPFPVELVRRLVHFYGWPGCTLLDPFAGSGTVGVAAVGLDCKAHLVDIDEAYCRLAERRVKAAYQGKNMLEQR